MATEQGGRRGRRQGRRGRRGTIVQVVLFTCVWGVLTGVLGLSAGPVAVGLGAARGAIPAEAAASALATVLAVWVMRRYFGGSPLLDLGLRRRPGWLADLAIGLALGPGMFLAILLLLLTAGWARLGPGTIGPPDLLLALLTYGATAFSEEVFARGWVLQALERGRGTRVAVVGSAGLFALLHVGNPDFGPLALLGLLLAGLLLAQAYLVTRGLWLPMALHLSWNLSEGPVFGFPVSGLPSEGLLTVTPTGPVLVTGGAFGPEGGLVVVLGIGLASAAIFGLGRRRARQAANARSARQLFIPDEGGRPGRSG